MKWEKRRFFAYMADSVYHVISKEVENLSLDAIEFFAQIYIVISDRLYFRYTDRLFLGFILFVLPCNIISASRATKKERLSYRKRYIEECVRYITFLTAPPSFYVIFPAFFLYSLQLLKWCTCWMAPIKIHNIAMGGILCDDIMIKPLKIWKSLCNLILAEERYITLEFVLVQLFWL